ncbi:phosphotransferase [Kitasatospora acidiphila]|uniref:Phosphotransferase n=1 Tax=Kitasatospora acidiphila TaxID=2567942 RepID=A0A540W2E6_9ACTN|nr:phosphotransferase [Kitasatospora acidiphila]TQF03173.1 phosphotransferase [Kitasatospora acidiphila]
MSGPDCLDYLSSQFHIGSVREVVHLPDGLMNDNWRIEADAGIFALKKIRDVPFDLARRNLRTLSALAKTGVPAPSPRQTADADPVVEVGRDGFSLVSWVEGRHRPGTDLPLSEVTALGALLGHLHEVLNRTLTGLPPVIDVPAASVTAPEATLAQIERFLAQLATLGEPTSFDEEAARFLVERRLLLEKFADERPVSAAPAGPFGWTHGDFQYRNVLWQDSEIVAVLDWDRIRVRPFGEEAVRTATVQFGGADGVLDSERVAAFMDGYRSVIAISPAELEDAVSRLWWKRMTDPWVLVFHYDRSDHSCDDLFAPQERMLSWWTERREEVVAAFIAKA